MEKNILNKQKEIIFASSDQKQTKIISRLVKKGLLRKIAPRIYTPIFDEQPQEIIKRNILEILGTLFPGCLLSHRSAFEFRPTSASNIFVTYKYTKRINLPGVVIRFLKGHKPIEGDSNPVAELYVSQKERAILENLQISKRPGPESKTLSLPETEEKLELILQVHGEDGLNKFRDKAREISKQIGMQNEFKKLNILISSLLKTKPVKNLKSSVAIARALGVPYDKNRVNLFEVLFAALNNREFKSRPDNNNSAKSFRNFAFYEAYFSNYIEGTKFTVEEARNIIDTGIPMASRNEDSHDVLGTYKIVSNSREIVIIPENTEELIKILLNRHKIILSARTWAHPGVFKERNNQAGNTLFVDFRLVRGTLIKGFDIYNSFSDSFKRAAFMMFFISEIHPFDDGNGRMARIMMNAELVSKGESKIIIPTVFREDYFLSLRKLSRQRKPDTYLDMLYKAHEFSEGLNFDNIDELHKYLEQCNAFSEEEGVVLKIRP